jgi:hypothetical protein
MNLQLLTPEIAEDVEDLQKVELGGAAQGPSILGKAQKNKNKNT